MKKLSLLIVLLLLIMDCFGQSLEKNFIDQNYIEVRGMAEMEIVPDEIYLQVIIREKDAKGKQTVEILERSMIRELDKLGIDIEKAVSIRDFSSNFKYYWFLQTDILKTKQYQILVHDAKTVGKVFSSLELINISNITIDRVDHSQLKKLRNQIKIEAIQNAQEKAKFLAEAVDQSVGRAIYIKELDEYAIDRLLRGRMPGISVRGAVSRAAAEEPEIDFEKIQLKYQILARFTLE